MNYSNPRTLVEIDDYPTGGSNRRQCRFEVEKGNGNKGYRPIRTTTNKYGGWCKPKLGTFSSGKVAFVDGEDGRTYVLRHIKEYRFVDVWRSDFMMLHDPVFESRDPTRYDQLVALIESAYPE